MPEYTNPEVAKIARKQKAVIWLTLIFAISLGFSVATIRHAVDVANSLASNKQIQEWVRIQRLNEPVAKPGSGEVRPRAKESFTKPRHGPFFLVRLSAWLPHLLYKPVAAVAIMNLVFLYQLARALKSRYTQLWVVLMLVPFVGLLVMPWPSFEATCVLLSYPWLWILRSVLILVPIVSLLLLLWLNRKATYVLRSKGIAVGLMGAKRAELEKLVLSD